MESQEFQGSADTNSSIISRCIAREQVLKKEPSSRRKSCRGFSLIELLIVVLIILLLASVAVPNYLSAKRSANEASAVASMRAISSGELAYRGTHGAYASLTNLVQAEIIDSALGSGMKSGYVFDALPGSDPNLQFSATASPSVSSGVAATGKHCFFVCQDQVIRFKTGAAADSSSSPLE